MKDQSKKRSASDEILDSERVMDLIVSVLVSLVNEIDCVSS